MNALPPQILELLDRLPAPLREPPGSWIALAAVALLALWGLWILGRRLSAGDDLGRRLEREARDLLRGGDLQEAGRAYEALGRNRKALRVYRKGECHHDRAQLLLRLGRRKEALVAARDGGEWQLYGELCREDGDLEEASIAFERAGQAYLAAQCYAEVGRSVDAARCYLAAGMEAEVVRLLTDAEGAEAAGLLDQAVRASLEQMGGSGLSLELQGAVQRGVQLWLAEGEPERAFRLAVAADRLKLAVPVARDYLEPSAEAAEICVRAGAHAVAADLYGRLGDTRAEALQRAELALRRDRRAEAAEWYEKAEEWAEAADQWAAAGDTERAARLFTRAGDTLSASRLTGSPVPSPETDEPGGHGGATVEQPWLTQAHEGSLEESLGSSWEDELATRSPNLDAVDPDRATVPSRPDVTQPAGAPTPVPKATVALEELSDGDRYQLLEELGRGGMGVVYRAEDQVLQRQVAYKMVPDHVLDVEVEPESLLAEARAAARLSHPNIVQVYDAGRRGTGFFVVMELIHGQSLEQILSDRQITLTGALRVGLQVCAALDHAHRRHIIHRDLKPSNLMWSDEDRTVKLADFGLARAFEASQGRVATQPAGTPSYMAPEQIRGEPVSPAVDVYSFGCVLFEMLCRESVFGNGPPSFHHHLTSSPRNPRELRPDLPEEPAALILGCLAKDPADRPESAERVGKTLARLLRTHKDPSSP